MRTFRRLEIECIGSDAFGLGSTIRTIIRQLGGGADEVYEAGSCATAKVFGWLKNNYFGYDALRKLIVDDYISELKDKNLAELLKRVLSDGGRNGLDTGGQAVSSAKR